MYVNTKTRLMCDLMGPKLRLLFEGGFYSSAAFIQDFTVCIEHFQGWTNGHFFGIMCETFLDRW